MEEKENTNLEPLKEDVDLISVVKEKDNELIDSIMQENDVEKLKDLTHVFNAFQTKRQILRTNALNDVQDALVQQMARRLQETPNNFNNNDIAIWMKTVQQTLDSTKNNIDSIDTVPTIVQQHNTQVNINMEDNLSRESREKIMDALQAILENVNNTDIDVVLENDNEVQEDNNNLENNFLGDDNNGSEENSNK